jgi:hypothetical protein
MKWTMLVATATLLTGCATTITSVPLSPRACKDARANSIPYYLPRPYLLVTKNFAVSESVKKAETSKQTELAKTTEKSTETTTASVSAPATEADVIAWQIIYLPDLDQKYGLRFKRGWGNYDTTINLVDGWQLAGINHKADAQTAATIGAIGTAVKDALSAIPAALLPVPLTKGQGQSEDIKSKPQPQKANAEFWLYDIGDLNRSSPVFHWSSPSP